MHVRRRVALLTGCVALAATIPMLATPTSAGAAAESTVSVRGTLLVAQSDAAGVAVTGILTDYPDVTTTSTDTAAVALGVLAGPRPATKGRTTVGWTLTARPGTWTTGTTLTFAWYADGKVIRHATAKRLRLGNGQRGKRITVKVTGKKTGYRTRTLTSARTAKVA